ncbi:hypothetical protein [Actinomycetospora sp. CA-053990]
MIAPLGAQAAPGQRRLAEGDTVEGSRVIAQLGHSPGLLAF